MQLGIARQVLEFSAQQIGDGDHGVGGGVTAGPCLRGLDLGIHGLHGAVAKAAAEVFEDRAPWLQAA